MNKEALWKAVKEPLRLLVLAVIPVIVVGLTELDAQWAFGAILVLRFIDKWMHEVGKARSTAKAESVLVKGITRF
jgi:hypothetical protein